MLHSLSIAVAQPCTRGHDVSGNVARHAAAVRRAGARVVVFPELSLTGYEFDAEAVDPGDSRLLPLLDACRQAGTVVFAGAPVCAEDGDGRSIGVLRLDAEAVSIAYRKIHLGEVEARLYTPGSSPSVAVVDGWRLGLAVCKDTGVEAHSAATAAAGMDIYVAGVLEHERDAHLPARRAQLIARSHSVWVAIASFAGNAGGGFDRAAGRSGIWKPNGRAAAIAGSACDDVVSVMVRPAAV